MTSSRAEAAACNACCRYFDPAQQAAGILCQHWKKASAAGPTARPKPAAIYCLAEERHIRRRWRPIAPASSPRDREHPAEFLNRILARCPNRPGTRVQVRSRQHDVSGFGLPGRPVFLEFRPAGKAGQGDAQRAWQRRWRAATHPAGRATRWRRAPAARPRPPRADPSALLFAAARNRISACPRSRRLVQGGRPTSTDATSVAHNARGLATGAASGRLASGQQGA